MKYVSMISSEGRAGGVVLCDEDTEEQRRTIRQSLVEWWLSSAYNELRTAQGRTTAWKG